MTWALLLGASYFYIIAEGPTSVTLLLKGTLSLHLMIRILMI